MNASQAETDRRVARVLWIVLGLNVAVATTKLGVGYAYNLLSLVADGVHSVLDGSSNVVGLVGLSLAARPPDRGHPYGHRRYESMTALGIGALISAAFFEIVGNLIDALRGQTQAPEVTPAAAIVVGLTILVNLWISHYESKQGRLLRSSILEADSAHTRSDAFAAGAVLVSFAGIAQGWVWADWVGAAVVALFVGRTALNVIHQSIVALADSAQLAPEAVRSAALGVAGVRDAHKIRSRGEQNAIYLDLHIHLDGDLSLDDAHLKTHEVKDRLMAVFPGLQDVVIHTEPAAKGTQKP